MYLISTCFLLINSCLNPVAVFCTSSPFRQHLKRDLTCCCKTNSPPADLELTRINWICNTWICFLYIQVGYIFYKNFHLVNYSNDNENCVALRKCRLCAKIKYMHCHFYYIQENFRKNHEIKLKNYKCCLIFSIAKAIIWGYY